MMTDLVFPESKNEGLELFVTDGAFKLVSLKLYHLR